MKKTTYREPNIGNDIQDYMIQVIDGAIFFRKNRYDADGGTSMFDHFEPWMLGESIQVRNTTYGQFWKLIEPEIDMWNIIFKGYTYGVDLRDWVGQMELPEEEAEYPSDIRYVYVSHGLERFDFEGDVQYNEVNNFGGYGYNTSKDIDGKESTCPTAWGIGFGDQRSVRDLPFHIDEDFFIWDLSADNLEDMYIDNNRRKAWTLWEVLSEIFFEITFHGSPKSGEDRISTMMKDVEEMIENHLDTNKD